MCGLFGDGPNLSIHIAAATRHFGPADYTRAPIPRSIPNPSYQINSICTQWFLTDKPDFRRPVRPADCGSGLAYPVSLRSPPLPPRHGTLATLRAPWTFEPLARQRLLTRWRHRIKFTPPSAQFIAGRADRPPARVDSAPSPCQSGARRLPRNTRIRGRTRYVGASNVTMPLAATVASAASNIDVLLQGKQNYHQLTTWFDQHWSEARDFQRELFGVLGQASPLAHS
jgi:hypothetical protein